MAKERLFLLDATAFCYRAFYALPALATSFGQPTGAIYGFINILNKILKEKKPDYLAVCFDVSRETFRTKKFAGYKIQRPPMPDGLSSQIPLIKEVTAAYGLPIYEKEGFEADDIIASLAKKAQAKGLSVTIVSSDKDILQLVGEGITVFSPNKEEGISYDAEKVRQRYGVEPEKIADIIALMGDSVDNIPGVPGVGEKTAEELVREFGSVEKLMQKLESVKQPKLREALKENAERINLNKELARLDGAMDIDFDPEKLRIAEHDNKELYRLFKYLEFSRFLKSMPQEEEEADGRKLEQASDKELRDLLNKTEELIISADNAQELVICSGDKFLQAGLGNALVKKILEDGKIKKVSCDLKKMKVALAGEGICLSGLYFDVMLAAYLLNPSKNDYSLAAIAWDYLGTAPAKELGSLKAVDLIRQLRPKLEEELFQKNLTGLFYDLEMPLLDVLAQMELNGIKLDLPELAKLSREIEKKLIKLIQDIYDASGTQFNINSTKQLRDVLFEKLKLPVIKKGKTGPSTDEEVLRALADKHELPALLLEYRQLMKLKTTYVDALPLLADKEGKVHTSFNQTVTETGRLSSSNPNLQNIPIASDIGKQIRRAIIAYRSQDYLLSCDYSQIELRILAHLSGDAGLIGAFKENKDIHKATAALIYGLEEKDVTDKMRDTAKRVNFGIVYGMTFYGLSRDLGIAPDQAQEFIDAYFLRYPKVKEYILAQIACAKQDGFVTTLLGRRRYIPQINNKSQGIRQFAERQAVNTPIQGTASDLIKLAMVDIHRRLEEKKLKAKMVLQIHDELVFDVRSDELEELAALAKDRMENVLKLGVPIRVEMKFGHNWLQMEPVKLKEERQ